VSNGQTVSPTGTITNLDLESAGAVLVWLVVEATCELHPGAHVAFYSDNDATVARIGKLNRRQMLGLV